MTMGVKKGPTQFTMVFHCNPLMCQFYKFTSVGDGRNAVPHSLRTSKLPIKICGIILKRATTVF